MFAVAVANNAEMAISDKCQIALAHIQVMKNIPISHNGTMCITHSVRCLLYLVSCAYLLLSCSFSEDVSTSSISKDATFFVSTPILE